MSSPQKPPYEPSAKLSDGGADGSEHVHDWRDPFGDYGYRCPCGAVAPDGER